MELYVGIDLHFMTIPMPLTINGFVAEDQGNFYVVINSIISDEAQKKAIKHELLHLLKNDINNDDPVEIFD